jgi:hypothetical protein
MSKTDSYTMIAVLPHLCLDRLATYLLTLLQLIYTDTGHTGHIGHRKYPGKRRHWATVERPLVPRESLLLAGKYSLLTF